MSIEDIFQHRYFKKIKEMCLNDDPQVEICNWVRNTVDDDDSIPMDQKMDHYITERKVADFKKLLKEEAGRIIIDTQTEAFTPAAETKALVTGDKTAVAKALVTQDLKNNIIDINQTFMNLFLQAQEKMNELESERDAKSGKMSAFDKKMFQSYISELRNMLKDYARITGIENYLQKRGSFAGKDEAKINLTEKAKTQIREWARKILAKVAPDEIPVLLTELEDVFDDKPNNTDSTISAGI
jgi:hypothetical protein